MARSPCNYDMMYRQQESSSAVVKKKKEKGLLRGVVFVFTQCNQMRISDFVTFLHSFLSPVFVTWKKKREEDP